MSGTPYLAVVKAEYEYAAATEEELSIAEDQLLYVLEDDDADWWKVRVKQAPSSGASPADAPTGLVPAGYVVPVPAIKQVTAQYEYTATSEEEISIVEGETYDLYEDDGEWSLIGARGKKEVGYAPTAYLEEGEGEGAASTPYQEAPAAAAMTSQATSSSIGRANGQGDKVKTWSGVTELDGKKKKKGTLGVGNGAIFFASDSDKAPVQKKSLADLNDMKTEKHKHIILTFADEELHFTVSSKDEHAEIVAKIEESREYANSGGADAAEEEPAAAAAAAAPSSNGAFVPPPPPPPPPPAVGGAFGNLPPPPRRMYNPSDDEDSDDDEPAPARAAPPAAAAAFIPPPPPPPPAPSMAVVSPPPRAPAAPARQDGKKAVAEYEFTAAGSEELSISEGETLWVLDDSADDWWKVRNERGEEGEVPASYITIEEGASGAAAAAAADTGDDESAARKLQEEQKAEARKEKERLRLKALEEEARGLSTFSNVNLPPPPRRTTAASPAPGSGTATPTRVTSPASSAVSAANVPPPPPPPPAAGSGGAPPRREDSGRDREADREERRRRHREERDRQRREEELLRNRGSTSMPSGREGGGHSAPVEKSKPNASRVRTWKDKTGAFKVDAEFIGLSGPNGEKIRLHKLNGVVIEVPIEKMSADDVRVIEHVTRRRMNRDRRGSGDDRRSSQAGGDREREREQRDRRDERRDRDERRERGGGDDSGHRARPPSTTAAGKRVSMAASQTKKSTIDWFDFFLSAGCDVDDCSRYANNFEKDRIDESILPDLEAGTLRSLGLREGDIIRVSKHIKNKMGSSAAQGGASASSGGGSSERASAQRAPSPPEKLSKEEQLLEDEELARKMQEELNAGRDGSGLFTNASGGIKNTRRGRPNANRAAPSSASMDAITSSLTGASDRTRTPDIDRRVSPDTSREANRRPSSTAPSSSGFDDDAWTVKPAAAPAKPSTPSLVDLSPSPSAPTPPPAPTVNQDLASPAPAMPSNSREASNAQALTDAYLESMGLGKRQVSSPAPMVNRQTASPAPQQQQQQQQNLTPQQTGYNAGPRAPVAPIPLNQQLLNPLIPTQTGMTGFVPTRNSPSPMMMPQQTGWQQPQMQMQQPQPQQPQMLAPMQTGYQGGMGMMQPQQTGYPMSQMSQMSIQPTGSPFNQPAMSASPSMYNQQQQMPQAPMQQPQPTSSLSSSTSSSSNAADYQPSNIFAQMKTGQFAKPADAPQAEQKYDSLRPQPTGFGGGFGMQQQQYPQQTGFGGMGMQQTGYGGGMQPQQQQQQMQPLVAQPTGFAPGGYVGMQPQQTGMMYGQPQQQGYPYRQF